MRSPLAFSLLLSAATVSAQPVYRCTDPAGRVTMQQTPCAGSGVASATIQTQQAPPRQAPPAAQAAPSGAAAAPPPVEPRRHWIVWSGNPAIDATRATANLEAIQMLGQACDVQIRNRRADLTDCRRFLEQLAPGGDFPRVADKLRELLADPAAARAVGESEFRRAERLTRDIVRLREFVAASIGQR